MAAGEYTSVASQRELARAEIEVERQEIKRHPAAEEHELSATYQQKGLDPELADKVAKQFHANPDQALEEHVREELGLDPNDLPSPVVAASSSFVCFAVGALIPLLPYLLGAGSVLPSLVMSLTALFICGAVVSRVTSAPGGTPASANSSSAAPQQPSRTPSAPSSAQESVNPIDRSGRRH